MRITTYEKGGNSLNPFIKLLIFLIILSLFVMPVSAWTDNFNDEDISNWDIILGSPTTHSTGGLDGSPSLYLEDDSLSYSFDNGYYTDISFYFRQPSGTGTTPFPYTRITFFDDDVTSYYVHIESQKIIAPYKAIFTIPGTTYSYTATSTLLQPYYKFRINVNSNTLMADVTVYYINGTILNTQEIDFSAIYQTTNKLTIYTSGGGSNIYAYVDNIEVSGLEGSPYTESGINWDEEQYIEGDTASYTWSLENSWWVDLIYKYQVQISKDGTEIDTVKVSQTGTRYFEVNNAGTYGVKLQYSGLIFTNWVSIDSDTVNVIPQVDSYINVPKIAEQKINFIVNYLYGTTPPTAAIFIKKLNEELEKYILYDIIYLDGGVVNIDYSQNISIWGEGFYKLILYNANIPEQDLKTDVIQITKVIIPPQTRINTSRIRSQLDTYSVSDMVWGDYTVDFTNYTSYVINLELYNYEYDTVVYSETVNDQCGVILIPLYASDLTIFTGMHNVRLSSYSNTGVFIDDIVYDNFTINLVNPNGYGLTLSKYEVYSDETFVIKCIVPQLSTIRIINRLTLEEIDNFDVNSSSYINYKISKIGDYEIRLISSSGYVEGNQYIKVVEGTIIDDPLIDEGEIIPDTTFQDNTTSLLNSPYLIGLFIMCVFLAIGATNGIGGTIVTGSIGLGIVCWMGIFPWILLVIEVLVVAVLMAKGMINLSGD